MWHVMLQMFAAMEPKVTIKQYPKALSVRIIFFLWFPKVLIKQYPKALSIRIIFILWFPDDNVTKIFTMMVVLKDLSFTMEDSNGGLSALSFWKWFSYLLYFRHAIISGRISYHRHYQFNPHCYLSHYGCLIFQTSNSSGRICHEYGCITVLRLLALRFTIIFQDFNVIFMMIFQDFNGDFYDKISGF